MEVIELTDHRFCLGVQWHPEQMPEEKALFSGFMEAASAKMLSRLVPRQPLLPESLLSSPAPAS